MNISKNVNIEIFVLSLLKWYEENKRDLPFRETNDPYKIWISEIMLQQTQVATVIPYFKNFIEKYPTVFDLANAEIEDVLKNWEGLGYYSRARNLYTAAKTIVEEYHGKFPSDYQDILSLKGVGAYTAGAISSIAFNKPIPAVDGNVLRVISRIFNIWDDTSSTKTKSKFEDFLKGVIPKHDPSSFNQGLMELGALICKPNPICIDCPINKQCEAFNNGYETMLPVKNVKTKQKTINQVVGIIQNKKGHYLMRKRPLEGLLGGLWEFVYIEEKDLEELNNYFINHYDRDLKHVVFKGKEKHQFSHLIWNMSIYHAKIDDFKLPNTFKFMTLSEINEVPISTAHKKLFDKIT